MIRRPPRSTLFPTRRSSDLLDAALGLWRGEAFTGVVGGWLAGVRLRIEDERFEAMLDRNDLAIEAGPPGRLLGELRARSEEHTSELQSQSNLVCRLLLEKKK